MIIKLVRNFKILAMHTTCVHTCMYVYIHTWMYVHVMYVMCVHMVHSCTRVCMSCTFIHTWHDIHSKVLRRLDFDGDKKIRRCQVSHKMILHFKHKRSIRNNDILSFCCNHLYYDTQGCVWLNFVFKKNIFWSR